MRTRLILNIGHRGAAGHAPENTLAALERGIALGADSLEVDVQRTRDGWLVLMHDKFVDRTTNGTGRLTELSYGDVRKLDAGEGQEVPLLEAVLETTSGRAGIILEIITPGIGRQLYRQVVDFGYDGPVIFASFLHDEITVIREMDSSALTMALMEAVPIRKTVFAVEAGATHAGLALDSMTREFGEALHDAGIQVLLYTPNTPEQIALAVELGADGIISDFPDKVSAYISR